MRLYTDDILFCSFKNIYKLKNNVDAVKHFDDGAKNRSRKRDSLREKRGLAGLPQSWPSGARSSATCTPSRTSGPGCASARSRS